MEASKKFGGKTSEFLEVGKRLGFAVAFNLGRLPTYGLSVLNVKIGLASQV